ncbi:MAG: hypothetical protein WAZ19_13240 [Anaerolineae bacterium]
MTTKLSRLCEALIEAGWLAALIIAPVFFNVHSSRVFEPDKISLVRSLALLMAAAWLVKTIHDGWGFARAGGEGERGSLWGWLRATPMGLPVLGLVVVYLISTVFSLTPRISWWGSYQRLQGTYTTLSYIIIFFMLLTQLRRPEQWRRIAYVIILTSLPVAIYGILQRSGADPLPWGGDVQRRVAANMGNAIFVAAYLLMAFFLTLERTVYHFGRVLRGSATGLADTILAGCYLFVLAVQSLTILFTQSRGPFLGLLAGLYVFGMVGVLGLRAWARGKQALNGGLRLVANWGWLGMIVGAVLILGFLVIFNLPNSPLASLRTNPYIGRLGTALDLEANTARVRTLIWQGASELVVPHDPLLRPVPTGDGSTAQMEPDTLNIIRPLIGYGPEAMWVAFNRYYPPDLAHHEARNASPDRSHNETFDSLVITGLFGFIAYMAVFISLFYYSLKWLGLIRNGRQRTLFLATVFISAALGALLPYLVQGNFVLAGLTLPGFLVIGIILYITVAALWNEQKGLPMHLGHRELIVMTILATLIAHFLEIHIGIAIVSTRTYFWVWSGVLVALGMNWLRLDGAAEAVPVEKVTAKPIQQPVKGKKRPSSAPVVAPVRGLTQPSTLMEAALYATTIGLTLFTLAFDYIINPNAVDLRQTNPVLVFFYAFTSRVVRGERLTSFALLWLVLFVLLVGLAIALFDISRYQPRGQGSKAGRNAAVFLAISLGIFFVFGLLHAASIAGDVQVQLAGGVTLDQLALRAANHIVTYYIVALILVLTMAALIFFNRPLHDPWLAGRGRLALVAAAVLFPLALFFIYKVNINLVRADAVYKQGSAYEAADRFDEAVYLYQLAAEIMPKEDYYQLFIGRAQLEQARQATDTEREAYLRQAEQSLIAARGLNPMNTDHSANLSRLNLAWAQMMQGDERAQRTQLALDNYAITTQLSPNAAHLHNEYAGAYQFAGDLDNALMQYQKSLSLDPLYVETYRRLGDFYRATQQNDLAISTYEKGLEIAPRDVALHSLLGYLYSQVNESQKAIEQNLIVLDLRPNDASALRNLTVLYSETGDKAAALRYAQAALEVTTDEDDRAALQTLIQQLQTP